MCMNFLKSAIAVEYEERQIEMHFEIWNTQQNPRNFTFRKKSLIFFLNIKLIY